MLPYRDNRLTRFALVAFFLLVAAYGYFEATGLLLGPRIDIPEGRMTVHQQLIMIRGTAAHIASLALNGAEIPVTESGSFEHPYLLAPGYNRIILDARDKYGKTAQKVLEIIYDAPSATSSPTVATSTAAASSTTPIKAATSTAPKGAAPRR